MPPQKRKRNDPDEYEPAETLILDDGAVMETSEFEQLVALDPDLFEEIEPPNLDDAE